jgi:hypothetical protein
MEQRDGLAHPINERIPVLEESVFEITWEFEKE